MDFIWIYQVCGRHTLAMISLRAFTYNYKFPFFCFALYNMFDLCASI